MKTPPPMRTMHASRWSDFQNWFNIPYQKTLENFGVFIERLVFSLDILSWGNFDKNEVTLINKSIQGKWKETRSLVLFETRFWDDIKFQDNNDDDAIWNIDPWIACLHGQLSVIEFYPFRMKLQIWSRNFHHFISSIIIGNWPIKMHLLWEDILSLFFPVMDLKII